MAQVNDYTSFCYCRMTSCRNLFHSFLLSFTLLTSLFLSVLLFSYCMSSKSHQAAQFFQCPLLPLLSTLVFLFCYCERCQNRNVFPLIFLPVRRFAAIETRTFSDCFMSGYLSLSSPSVFLCVFVSISSLIFVISLTVQSLFPCLSSSLHPSLPSVTHLSLPFTNQYAGQQAV